MPKNKIPKNKELSVLMAEYKLTLEEAKDWLKLKNLEKCVTAPEKERTPIPLFSNVCFHPAQHTENTKISVENSSADKKIEMTNVVKAILTYNPDLGLPTLTIEIVNPKILNFN